MIKGVVFDLDNTLYDYECPHEKAMEALRHFACNKYSLTSKEFDFAYSSAQQDVKNQVGKTGASHNRMLYMQMFLEKIKEKPVVDSITLYEIYWDTFIENMHIFPYVKGLLDELRTRDISIMILTDLTAYIQHRKLLNMGIADYIDILVSSEEAGVEKPELAAFNRLLSKTTYKPAELLMIGDSLEKDIYGGKSIGMYALLFEKNNKHDMDKRILEYIDEINKLG